MEFQFRNTSQVFRIQGLTLVNAAWQHSVIESPESFSERQMMRIAYINQPTKRLALGPCFVHGSDRPAVMVWSFSGRAAE